MGQLNACVHYMKVRMNENPYYQDLHCYFTVRIYMFWFFLASILFNFSKFFPTNNIQKKKRKLKGNKEKLVDTCFFFFF